MDEHAEHRDRVARARLAAEVRQAALLATPDELVALETLVNGYRRNAITRDDLKAAATALRRRGEQRRQDNPE